MEFPLPVKLAALVYPIKNDLSKLWKLRLSFYSAMTGAIIERLSCRGEIKIINGEITFNISNDKKKIHVEINKYLYPVFTVNGVYSLTLSHDQVLSAILSPTFTYSETSYIPEYHIDHKVPPSLQILSLSGIDRGEYVKTLFDSYTDMIHRVLMFRFVDQVYKDLAWKEILKPLGFVKRETEATEGFHPDNYNYVTSIDGDDYELEINSDVSTTETHSPIEYIVKSLTG